MSYLALFASGTAIFAVLPVYTPFVVLQEEQVPRFLAGLLTGMVVGPLRGFLLLTGCAVVGASLYVFAYYLPTLGPLGRGLTSVYLIPIAACYSIIPAAVAIASVERASATVSRFRHGSSHARTSENCSYAKFAAM